MSALGDTFRNARESQGLTLSDVAERTHIRPVFLAAIEAEDWSAIGPPVYIRGFLRTYARSLGLDPDAAVAGFSNPASGGTPAASVVFAPAPRSQSPVTRRSSGSAPQRGLSLGAIVGVAVACALVLFVGYQYVDYRRAGTVAPNGHRAAATGARPVQPERAGRELQPPAAAERHPTVKNDERPSGFALRLRDSSWLRVVVDGKVAMEGLYPAGTARTFAGRSATVRVGNAGGVDISVDGKDLGPMGGLGDVAERSFQL